MNVNIKHFTYKLCTEKKLGIVIRFYKTYDVVFSPFAINSLLFYMSLKNLKFYFLFSKKCMSFK